MRACQLPGSVVFILIFRKPTKLKGCSYDWNELSRFMVGSVECLRYNTRQAGGQENGCGTAKNEIRKYRFRWSNQVWWRLLNLMVWLSDLICPEDSTTEVNECGWIRQLEMRLLLMSNSRKYIINRAQWYSSIPGSVLKTLLNCLRLWFLCFQPLLHMSWSR